MHTNIRTDFRLYIYLVLLCLITSCTSSRHLAQKNANRIYNAGFIDQLFEDYKGQRPGASVIVIKDGKIELEKSYGYANLDEGQKVKATTNYRIASLTKQFTAMAIMRLVYEGRLSYDTKLTDVFPDFPRYGEKITIQHLLTHRSGLVKYTRFIKMTENKQLLDKDVLQGLMQTDSTYFEPGTQYAYCNTGYAVLAQVVEKITGLSFSTFMEKEIFEPLGMRMTTVFESNKDIANRAYGYSVYLERIKPEDQSKTSAIQGDGCIYTSISDYYKWDQALYTDQLLPQSVLEKAFFAYDEQGLTNKAGYGYGWKIGYHNEMKILQHGGATAGFGSHVIRIPSEKITVAIFTNRNKRGDELSNRAKALVSYYLGEKYPTPFEVVVEPEIKTKGLRAGLHLYNQIKKDTINYAITKRSLFSFGLDYLNYGESEIAFAFFEQQRKDHPTYFGGYFGQGLVYADQDEYRKAIDCFEKTIQYCTADDEWAKIQSEEYMNYLKSKLNE